MNWIFLLAQVQGRDGLLRQPVRQRLMNLIRRHPGIHASQICRETGEAWGTVQYHLGLLHKNEMVASVASGREKRFFPNGMDARQTRMLSILNQGRRAEIAAFIRENPGIRQVDICDAVGVSRKTFRASITALVEAGLVDERKGLHSNHYFPQKDLEAMGQRTPWDDYDVT